MLTLLKLVILTCFMETVFTSPGDRSYVFQKCLEKCIKRNCTNTNHIPVLQWSCDDKCKYSCMWTTVEAFEKDGRPVPQFYGKWPFVKVGVVQEPASMVFSLLNALSHLMIFYYWKNIPQHCSMFYVWTGMALVSFVTWICAAVFHTRDLPITEKMDYFSAFGLVLYNLFTFFCRFLGTENTFYLTVISLSLLAFYCYHIYFLSFVHFDYGYNMKVNIAFGAVNAVLWIIWCVHHRKERPYIWKCIAVLIGLNLLLSLEVFDFSPLLWTFDAHSIWHAGTVVLNFLWYSFIMDDSLQEIGDRSRDYKKMV